MIVAALAILALALLAYIVYLLVPEPEVEVIGVEAHNFNAELHRGRYFVHQAEVVVPFQKETLEDIYL